MSELDETIGRSIPAEPGGLAPDAALELVRILDGYLADLHAGGKPDRARVLADHPELADELARCLSGVEFIHRAAGPTEPGAERLGEFRIIREVGRGGMGVVYEAEQTSLRRRVALKVLRYGAVADVEAMERFRREAETVARLHHTNIVPIFAIGSERDVHYYAMQFIEGRSLADVLAEARDSGRLADPMEVVRWGLQAAEALAHAHQRGVIHRDIKPSNLLLDAEGTVWLTDFGLARRIDEVTLTVSGALMGTPRYMSPEQAESLLRPVDHRTDVYSLGATLYELATGRPVFEAATPHAVIARILADEPVAPRQVRPGLPRDLETVILTCLAKDPARRYATAQALADDLRAILDGRPIRARRTSAAERAVRWARRNRRFVTTAAVSAAAAAVLIAGTLFVREGYRRANLGTFALTTDEPHLSAEVLESDGENVVLPRFSLPTLEPVELPSGAYQVRLSAPGLPGETYDMEVGRGGRRSYRVGLKERRLWEPIPEQKYSRLTEVVKRSGRADLLEWTSARRLSLNDGRSALPVWTLDFSGTSRVDPATRSISTSTPAPGGERAAKEEQRLRSLLGSLPDQATGRIRIIDPSPDLDGDGDEDLVIVCRNGASLWALSGRGDGQGGIKELWSFGADAGHPSDVGEVMGVPAVGDADGDGTPDVMATLKIGTGYRVEAISGRTGRLLWRCVLDDRWCVPPPGEPIAQVTPAVSANVGGRIRLVIVTPGRIAAIDPKTGKVEVSVAPDTKSIHPPIFADLDGDGSTDALIAGRGTSAGATIEAVSLHPPRTLWVGSAGAPLSGGGVREVIDWPRAADLDGDGASEVILPAASAPGQATWTGVEVRRGRDGSRLWSRRLRWPLFPPNGSPNRLAVGPDVDGDGWREVFAASPGGEQKAGEIQGLMYVDALSGRDGHTLWWCSRPTEGWYVTAGPLRWWHSGADGWPQLLVPSERLGSEAAALWALSAGTGRVLDEMPGGSEPREADFDGDGVLDLAVRVGSFASGGSGALHALRGLPPSPWARLGIWTPVSDLDGDGLGDLLEADEQWLKAASGRDGRVLWRSGHSVGGWRPAPEHRPTAPGPANTADLDRDGTPDILLSRPGRWSPQGDPGGSSVPLRAISGRTGARLWDAQGVDLAGFSGSSVIWAKSSRFEDLDGDGEPEVIVGLVIEGVQGRRASVAAQVRQARIAVLSGRDGRVRWERVVEEYRQPSSNLFLANLRPQPVALDLDQDGVRDLLVTVPVETVGTEVPVELLALAGRNGRPLWRVPIGPRASNSLWSEQSLPLPVGGDLDGDGRPEVVVADWVARAPGEGGMGGNAVKTLEVQARDGRSGRLLWPAWRSTDCTTCGADPPGDAPRPPVLLPNEGGRGSSIAVVLHEIQESRLVLLDARGRVAGRWKPPDGPHSVQQIRQPLLARDLDGDGRDELVFVVQCHPEARVFALDTSLRKVRWHTAVPAYSRIDGLRPAAVGQGLELVVACLGNRVVGLDGKKGRRLWEGWGFTNLPSMTVGGSPLFNAALLSGPVGPKLPWVIGNRADATICLTTLPAAGSGPAMPVWRAAPARSAGVDPRHVRALPWAEHGPFLLEYMARGAGLALVVLVVPGATVAWVLRARPLRLGRLLVLPVIAAGLLAVLLWFDPQLGSGRGGTAGGPLRTDSVSVLLAKGLELFLRALGGLPVAAVVGMSAVWAYRGQWRMLGFILTGSVVGCVVVVPFLLRNDLPPGQVYSSRGWAWIWLVGAYLAGIVVAIGLGGRSVVRLIRRAYRARRPASSPPSEGLVAGRTP